MPLRCGRLAFYADSVSKVEWVNAAAQFVAPTATAAVGIYAIRSQRADARAELQTVRQREDAQARDAREREDAVRAQERKWAAEREANEQHRQIIERLLESLEAIESDAIDAGDPGAYRASVKGALARMRRNVTLLPRGALQERLWHCYDILLRPHHVGVSEGEGGVLAVAFGATGVAREALAACLRGESIPSESPAFARIYRQVVGMIPHTEGLSHGPVFELTNADDDSDTFAMLRPGDSFEGGAEYFGHWERAGKPSYPAM